MATLASSLREALVEFLAPLADGGDDPQALTDWLARLGQSEVTARDPALVAIAQKAVVLTTALSAFTEEQLESWDGLAALVEQGQQASTLVADLRAFAENPAHSAVASGLAEELMALLLASFLRRRHPLLFRVACLLTLIEPTETGTPDAPIVDGDTTLRYSRVLDRFRFAATGDLLSHPGETLAANYLPNGMTAGADAWLGAERLFAGLSFVADVVGMPWDVEYRPLVAPPQPTVTGPIDELPGEGPVNIVDPPAPEPIAPPPDSFFAAHHPTFRLILARTDTGDVGLALAASSRQHPGAVAGFIVTPIGRLSLSETRGRWRLAVTATGAVPAVVLGTDGPVLAPADHPLAAGSARLEVTRVAAPGEPAFVFGDPAGSRVEIGSQRVSLAVTFDATHVDLEVALEASSGVLVLAADDDALLRHFLPEGGIRAAFDLGLVYSTRSGLSLKGGAGLEAGVPANVSAGPVRVDALRLSLAPAPDGVTTRVAGALGLDIGPVHLTADGVGVEAALRFPPDGGSFGAATIDVGLARPTGLAVAVDAGPVTGGGALDFDPARGQYAGEMNLRFENIAVRAIGLLTTRLPDGRDGFSLLVIVSADFPPVQLGLGFMLVGVGGLLGINRTVAVETLRAGLKTGALGAVLSPPDPKANAAQLVATVASFFPPSAGRHVFAPTARIVWGSPVLITIELCLALELPSPVRLVALGRLRAVLPAEREAIVRLQVDLLGVIDFDAQTAAVDATLIDSRLAQFALTGDLALRMSWGANPAFLLAVGGFHPRFSPPPGFPALERVAIALASGDNPKLRLEAYLALTSNTVQFGARVDLGARAGGFSIAGFMSFDALVTLSPLSFVVDIAAKLAVKAGSRTLFSISLSLTLSGPRPWHAKGRASFSILFFDISFHFDVTIGDAAAPALPPPVDVGPLVLAAFKDPRAWGAQLPAGADAVILRALQPDGTVLAHPLATLEVRQRVAPLERTLDRFGTSVPSGARRFQITLATIGGVRATVNPLTDRFAPAQFTAMSDDEKLSAPSFEELRSGATLGADGYATGAPVTVSVIHEQLLVTAPGIPEPKSKRVAIPADVFATLTATRPQSPPAFAVRDVA
jgi:Family of unknown function (DUF6603)